MSDSKYIRIPVSDISEIASWLRDHEEAIGLSSEQTEYLISGKPYATIPACTRISYTEVEEGFLVECDSIDSEQEKALVDNYISATPGTKVRIYDHGKTPPPVDDTQVTP